MASVVPILRDLIEILSKQGSQTPAEVLGPDGAKSLRRNLNRLNLELEDSGEIVDRITYSVSLIRPRCTKLTS